MTTGSVWLAVIFLILALISYVLGARGVLGFSMDIAKWLVIIFTILAVLVIMFDGMQPQNYVENASVTNTSSGTPIVQAHNATEFVPDDNETVTWLVLNHDHTWSYHQANRTTYWDEINKSMIEGGPQEESNAR